MWRLRVLVAALVATMVVLPHAATRARAFQAPDDGSAISGQVVDSVTNAPVRGATVELLPQGPAVTAVGDPLLMTIGDDAARTAAMSPRSRTTAGPDGTFAFRGLGPGLYLITAQHQLFQRGGYGGGYQHDGTWQALSPIRLGTRQQISGLTVRLAKFAAITGRIVDEAGEPMIGLGVHVLRREWFTGTPHFVDTTEVRTDDRGTYRATGLKPGDYIVGVPSTMLAAPVALGAGSTDAPGIDEELKVSGGVLPVGETELIGQSRIGARGPAVHLARSGAATQVLVYPTTFAPAASSPAAAAVIALDGGGERTADIELAPVPAARVTGAVDLAGSPTHVSVRLLPDWAGLLTSDRGFETALAVTDERGSFTLFGVPPGAYTVSTLIAWRAWVPDPQSPDALSMMHASGPTTLSYVAVPPKGATDSVRWATAPVTVGDRDVEDVTLALQPGSRLSGRIEIAPGSHADPIPARPNAFVMGPGGLVPAPPPGAFDGVGITISQADTQRYLVSRRAALTPQGEFVTDVTPPGPYFLGVLLARQWYLQSATVNGHDVFCAGVDLRHGDISDAVLTIGTQETTLAGAVQFDLSAQSGQQTDDLTVAAFPADVDEWIAGGMNAACAKVTSAAGGRFVLRNLAAGDYFVGAFSGGLDVRDSDAVRAASRGARRVAVRPGANQTEAPIVRE